MTNSTPDSENKNKTSDNSLKKTASLPTNKKNQSDENKPILPQAITPQHEDKLSEQAPLSSKEPSVMKDKNSTPQQRQSSTPTNMAQSSNSNISKTSKTQPTADLAKSEQGQNSIKSQSDNTKKIAPENKTKNNQHTTAMAPNKSKGNKASTILSGISLVMVLALGGYLYHHITYQNNAQLNVIEDQQQAIRSLSTQLNELKKNYDSLSSTKNTVTQLQQQMTTELHQQQKTIDTLMLTNEEQAKQFAQLKTKVSAIMEADSVGDTYWLLTESNYFLKQATRKLNSDHDVTTAITLLLSADTNLAELNDPSLNTIRNAINHDLTTLRAIPRIDRDGIIIKLQQLSQQINTLSMLKPKNLLSTDDDAKSDDLSDSINDWRHNLTKSWKSFVSGFITIKQRNGVNDSNKPELTPNQSAYLQENIRMQLLIASQAVPIQQQDIYNASLEKALAWSKEYYNTQDTATQAFITELENLSKESINVSLPTELTSQPLLDKVVRKRVRNLLTESSSSNKLGD